MNRLVLVAAGLLALGSLPALAQDASPTPPPKANDDTHISVAGHVFTMPDHCPLAAYVERRDESLNGQRVTLRPWFHAIEGWLPGTPYDTDAIDPANPVHDAHVGDLLCIAGVKS